MSNINKMVMESFETPEDKQRNINLNRLGSLAAAYLDKKRVAKGLEPIHLKKYPNPNPNK